MMYCTNANIINCPPQTLQGSFQRSPNWVLRGLLLRPLLLRGEEGVEGEETRRGRQSDLCPRTLEALVPPTKVYTKLRKLCLMGMVGQLYCQYRRTVLNTAVFNKPTATFDTVVYF